MKAQVLVVDDEPLIRNSLQKALASTGHAAESAESVVGALSILERKRFDLCVVDLKLGDGSGLDILRKLHADAPETKVVVITAHGSVDTAVEAMKLGAYDFVKKPFELDELLATADNALRAGSLEKRVAYQTNRDRSKVEDAILVGRSPTMLAVAQELKIIASQPVPVVLVTGETGSGKALAARAIHFGSNRAAAPFVELNAAAIPENLVESELFGHERGAFSDARERKLGLVEVADQGTLFLDEVGDLSASAQAKLLTFLDSFTFRRVGATATRTVDVRIIAATNRDLSQLAKEGRFRSDLLYRLSALSLRIPPLRERAADIVPLAEHFMVEYAQKYQKSFRSVSTEAGKILSAWRWLGNVRELKAVLNRAVLMNDGTRLLPTHLPSELVAGAIDPLPDTLSEGVVGIRPLAEIELRYMRAVLDLTCGNKVRAAEYLGITRQTLSKRLEEE